MKTLQNIITFSLLVFSANTFARPTGFYLVSPTKLVCSGDTLTISFVLPCSNRYADDWGDVVFAADDSGDREVAVGIVAATSECKTSSKLKDFSRNVDLKSKGFNACNEQSFHRMILAK